MTTKKPISWNKHYDQLSEKLGVAPDAFGVDIKASEWAGMAKTISPQADKPKGEAKDVAPIVKVTAATPEAKKLSDGIALFKLRKEYAMLEQEIADVADLKKRLVAVAEREAKIDDREGKAEAAVSSNTEALRDAESSLSQAGETIAKYEREVVKAEAHCLSLERKIQGAANVAAEYIVEYKGGGAWSGEGLHNIEMRRKFQCVLDALDVTFVEPEEGEEAEEEEAEEETPEEAEAEEVTEEVPAEPIEEVAPSGLRDKLKRWVSGSGKPSEVDDDRPIRVG